MDSSAKKLRNLIATYRGLIAEGPELNATRHYLNEIVLAEMRLRSLADYETEQSAIGSRVSSTLA